LTARPVGVELIASHGKIKTNTVDEALFVVSLRACAVDVIAFTSTAVQENPCKQVAFVVPATTVKNP
jgi:hypothetical protein